MTVADSKLPKWDCPRCGAPVHQVVEFWCEFECGTTQERGGAIREHRSCLIRQVADLKQRLKASEHDREVAEVALQDCQAKAAALEAGKGCCRG